MTSRAQHLFAQFFAADKRLQAVLAEPRTLPQRPGEHFVRVGPPPPGWSERHEAASDERQRAAGNLWGYFESDQPCAEERAAWIIWRTWPKRKQQQR